MRSNYGVEELVSSILWLPKALWHVSLFAICYVSWKRSWYDLFVKRRGALSKNLSKMWESNFK